MSSLDLSVVVPLHNEEESVALLHRTITESLSDTEMQYEIIFVDDGSKDRTLEIATAIAMNDHRLRVVEFRTNYVQTPAMAAGMYWPFLVCLLGFSLLVTLIISLRFRNEILARNSMRPWVKSLVMAQEQQ